MNQPQWSGVHPDFIVLKEAEDVIDVSGMAGSWLDRREKPLLETAAALINCKIEPTNEFEVSDLGVAEVWLISKNN